MGRYTFNRLRVHHGGRRGNREAISFSLYINWVGFWLRLKLIASIDAAALTCPSDQNKSHSTCTRSYVFATSSEVNMNSDMAEIAPLSVFQKATAAVQYIRISLPPSLASPRVGIICGSGLGGLADTIHPKPKYEVAYADIPHFPVSTGMSTGKKKSCYSIQFCVKDLENDRSLFSVVSL
jgi:hypothetical protein